MNIRLKLMVLGIMLPIATSVQAAWYVVDQASWQQWEAERDKREVIQFRLARLNGEIVAGGGDVNRLGRTINALIDEINAYAQSADIKAFLKKDLYYTGVTLPCGIFIFRDSKNFKQLLALAERKDHQGAIRELLKYAVEPHSGISLVCPDCPFIGQNSGQFIKHREEMGVHGRLETVSCED